MTGPLAPQPGASLQERGLSRSWEAAILLLITLLAAALRFYRLTEVPPGLHFDEGFKGVTARGLLAGAPPQLFFERDMGEEPAAIYLVAAALGLVGEEPWAVRLPSAIVGTLTVPLAWWLGRELFRLAQSEGADGLHQEGGAARQAPSGQAQKRLEGQLVGLGTALTLAILYWHLSFSRIGMEPILVPFTATLAFAALARGLNLGGRGWPATLYLALAGFALGGSLYTYKAGYFVPVVALFFVGYAAIVERGFLRRHGRGLLVAACVALLVALPIGTYFATHPANFLQRPASVLVVGQQAGSLVDNLPRVLGMFFVRGDANPRSNLPGRPALDPFLGLLFLAGLVRAMLGFRRPAYVLPILWLAVMVLPTLVTEYAPHFGRAIGATPAVALLCALGAWAMVFGIGDSHLARSRIAHAKTIMAALLAVGLVFAGASTARAYFHTWARSPDLFYAYDVGLADIARYANAIPEDEQVYVTPVAHDHYTLQFLTRRPLASFDGRAGLPLPPPGQPATIIVLLREDGATLPALQRLRPDGRIVWMLDDAQDQAFAVAYRLSGLEASLPTPDHPAGATFGGTIRLLGYALDAETVAPGETVQLTLAWQALAPVDQDYTVFAHLLGEHNPATDGPLWAGHDGQPDGGHYPTSAWQPGQVVLDVHPLAVPAGTPPGEYQLEIGLYLLETMARLPAVDAAGHALAGDAVLVGTIEIGW